MTPAVIYTRVSSAEQLREGFSIAAQEKILRDYVARNGMIIVAEFSDDETAKTTGRRSFNEMLTYVSAHPGTSIIVEKVDRLYRNVRDYITIDDLGVEVHFVKEGGRDRQDADARFMHLVRVGMARKYVENLSEEVKKGQRQKCEEGGWPTWAPLGYINVKDPAEKKRTGGIVLDPEKAPLVVQLFEAAATGECSSLGALARLAERLHLRGRWGARLGKQVVSNVLHATAYYGEFTWGGKTYRGKYEPLIDRDLFERAQDALRDGAKPKTRTHVFAYAGAARCGACGGVLTGDVKKGKYIYYSCRGARACKRYYAEGMFDSAIDRMLQSLVLPAIAREAIIDEIGRRHGATARQQLTHAARIRTRLTELERVSLSAYEEKLLGKLPEAMWRELSERWATEGRGLRAELKALQPNVGRDDLLQAAREPFELVQVVAAEYLRKDAQEKGRVVKTCCSNLLVTDGSISIQLRSPFDAMAKFEGGLGWLANVDEYRTAILRSLAA